MQLDRHRKKISYSPLSQCLGRALQRDSAPRQLEMPGVRKPLQSFQAAVRAMCVGTLSALEWHVREYNEDFRQIGAKDMALRVQTQICGHVYVLHCEGRIVFGDEGAALHERVRNLLTGTPQIVINLSGVDHIDSGGIGVLVGLFVAARNRGGELKLVSPNEHVYTTL